MNALVLLTGLHLRTVATAAISGCIFGPKVFQLPQILSLIQEVSAGLHSSLSTLRHTLPSHRAERFLLSRPHTRSSCPSSWEPAGPIRKRTTEPRSLLNLSGLPWEASGCSRGPSHRASLVPSGIRHIVKGWPQRQEAHKGVGLPCSLTPAPPSASQGPGLESGGYLAAKGHPAVNWWSAGDLTPVSHS